MFSDMRTFLKYWLPVFIWLGVIFAGSTDIFDGTNVALSGAFFALAPSGDLNLCNRHDPFCAAQDWSPYRVCSSGGPSLAGAAQRKELACENVDLVRRSLGCLCNYCGERSNSSITYRIADSVAERRSH